MYIARGLLILSFGSMLKFISCYSDGSLLEDQCQEMNIHDVPEQDTESPFKVEPENVTLTDSEWNTPITVTLSGGSFMGFMLDSRECNNCKSVGTFSLEDNDNSLLICDASVVTHLNNLPKDLIRVFWTPKAAGLFFFRAAVVNDFNTFWRRKQIDVPSTTPLSSETSAHTRLTTSPTIFPTDSHATAFLTGTSAAPTTSEANSAQTNLTTSTTKFTSSYTQATVTSTLPSQCAQYMRCVLALLLFSRLCFLGGSSLLIIIRPVLKKTATMSASVLELACKTIAVILVLIKAIKYECVYECDGSRIVFTALTVAAMVSSLLHTITVFLHCGPSHELRKCWLCAIIMVDLMDTTITTTAIFFGTFCFEDYWLPILMGVYVVWEIMLYLGSVCYEHMEKYQTRKKVRKNQNHILEKRISPWLCMFIIFTIVNVSLTAALMTGVSLVRMIN
ncbi:uncharacterized protein LOC143732940 [Siphateles boraxobius]|uniref:uncharacterized protein LOC143732940 n=1 Tax=Siphateles boraxobius TaxID=180520 RepID=UPI004062D7AC